MTASKLVRRQIIDLIKSDSLLTNYDLENCVSPASYEMRVRGYYDWTSSQRVEIGDGRTVAVAPRGFAIFSTMEQVALPNDIIGMMYLRSTYARRGFTPWFQGIVDPGYQGGLSVILHNLTPSPILITGGERICHLVFERLPEPADEGYQGSYQHSPGGHPAADKDKGAPIPVIGQPLGGTVGGGISPTMISVLEQLGSSDPEALQNLLKRLLY